MSDACVSSRSDHRSSWKRNSAGVKRREKHVACAKGGLDPRYLSRWNVVS